MIPRTRLLASPPRYAARAAAGAVLFAATLATSVGAQTIAGRVTEAGSERPVAFALVVLSGPAGASLASAATDANGRFRISAPGAGSFRLTVETLFHHPAVRDSIRVGPDQAVTLPDIELELAPIGLDELRVEVGRSGLTSGMEWVRRNQLHGKGTFLPGSVVALNAKSSLALYISTETRLWARFDARGRATLVNPAGSISRCMQVLVNRWRIERTGYRSIDEIPRSEIAAIEIYESERDLPPGYYFDGEPGCGIVNVWLWNSWGDGEV